MFSKVITLLTSTLLLSLLTAGCGRFAVTIERVDEPSRATTQIEPLPVTSTPIPAAPAAVATVVPTAIAPTEVAPTGVAPTEIAPATVTATPMSAVPTAPISLGATYSDTVAGIAMDYPAGWEIFEVDEEQKATAFTYATTFQSWVAGPGGGGGIPDGATKIDLIVYPNRGSTLDEATTLRRTEIESPGAEMTLLSEEPVTLASGMEGVRFRTHSVFGEASEIVTVANGHLIIFSGIGDGAQINQILQTLRSVGTGAATDEPSTPRVSDVSAIRIVEGAQAATVVGGPGQENSPVAQIPEGMTVAVSGISADGGWYQLAGCGEQNPYRPAPDCWISADQSVSQPVRPIAPSQQPVLETETDAVLIVAQNMANVRSGPGTDYPVISQLAGGFTFPVIGVSEDGGWWRLSECSSPLNEVLDECWISADPEITQPASGQ